MLDQQPLKRWFPRRKVALPCLVSWDDRQVQGWTVDVPYSGVGVLLTENRLLGVTLSGECFLILGVRWS